RQPRRHEGTEARNEDESFCLPFVPPCLLAFVPVSPMILLRLVLSNLAVHRVRGALTVAAIALSVSLVVAVTTGYSSSLAAATKFLGFYMGTSDLTIGRGKGDPGGTFPETLANELRADP